MSLSRGESGVSLARSSISCPGGFQQMLQSQKRFEFNPEFWKVRWGMKELKEGDTVMAAFERTKI